MSLQTIKNLYEKPLPKRPEWIESGILTKSSKMLLGGEGKIGKTFLLLNMAVSLCLGGSLWGVDKFTVSQPTGVLYIEQELGEYGLQKRVKDLFDQSSLTVPDNFYYLSRVPELEMDRRHGRELLERELKSQPDIGVVMIDPISQSMYGDDSNNNDVKAVFNQIDYLLNAFSDRGLSVVLSHHFGKPPKLARDKAVFDPADKYNFRGASKWVDNPDSLMTGIRVEVSDPKILWKIHTAWTLRHAKEPEGNILNVMRTGEVKESRGMFNAV